VAVGGNRRARRHGWRLAGTLTTDKRIKTLGGFWHYTTTLWSYIHRAQPFDEPGSLTPDQVYAVTAYVRVATL
jgi:cytochrome c